MKTDLAIKTKQHDVGPVKAVLKKYTSDRFVERRCQHLERRCEPLGRV